ncbi:MAG: hypothetical protein HY914_02325 [Desulfomonile tiedjei]|nr:hypothetical protein [Desulfomonile tiedjei]
MTSGRHDSNPSKLLAFYGSDLVRADAGRFLRKARRKGYELVALDSAAMALARSADVPYSLIEDYLDPASMASVVRDADEARRKWFEPARDLFTVEGVCWPELDQRTVHAAWENALLALRWAEKIKRAGVQELSFFRHVSPRFQVQWERSDIAAVVWEQALPGIARPRLSFEAFRPASLASGAGRAVRRILSRRESSTSVETGEPVRTGSIFVLMAGLEALRYSDIVVSLHERFPEKVAVAVVKPYPKIPDEIPWKGLVPIVYGPLAPTESWEAWTLWKLTPRIRFRIGERFAQGYEKAVDSARGTPWEQALASMRFHFSYYTRFRWPWLSERTCAFWRSLWDRLRPAAVLCSSLEDALVLTPVAAAKSLGIRTYSLPHGGIHLCYSRPSVDYAFCGNSPQRWIYESIGLPASRLIASRDLVAPREYRTARQEAFSDSRKLRVLALTDTTDVGTNLMKWLSLRSQLVALQCLASPPRELADRIEVVVKAHPHYSDLDIIAAASSDLSKRVLPTNSDLHAAVAGCDLVVAVNYYGSALIHVLMAGKPVAYLLTESDPLVHKVRSPFGLFKDGTTVVRTREEFWKLIQSFMTDPAVGASMCEKARAFAEAQLDYSRFPGVAEAVEHLLGGTNLQ